MNLSGKRQSENVQVIDDPFSNALQTLLSLIAAGPDALRQIPPDFDAGFPSYRDAEIYYKMKTGRDPSQEFFDQLFRRQYIPPELQANVFPGSNVGTFRMNANPAPNDLKQTLLSLASIGNSGLMTREEGKIFTHTGPTRRPK